MGDKQGVDINILMQEYKDIVAEFSNDAIMFKAYIKQLEGKISELELQIKKLQGEDFEVLPKQMIVSNESEK